MSKLEKIVNMHRIVVSTVFAAAATLAFSAWYIFRSPEPEYKNGRPVAQLKQRRITFSEAYANLYLRQRYIDHLAAELKIDRSTTPIIYDHDRSKYKRFLRDKGKEIFILDEDTNSLEYRLTKYSEEELNEIIKKGNMTVPGSMQDYARGKAVPVFVYDSAFTVCNSFTSPENMLRSALLHEADHSIRVSQGIQTFHGTIPNYATSKLVALGLYQPIMEAYGLAIQLKAQYSFQGLVGGGEIEKFRQHYFTVKTFSDANYDRLRKQGLADYVSDILDELSKDSILIPIIKGNFEPVK